MMFLNVTPVFPENVEYMVNEAKRLAKDVGLNTVVLSMTLHPEGHDPIQKAFYLAEVFRRYKNALKGTEIHVGVLFQSLLGHGWCGQAVCETSWQNTVDINGKTTVRQCPTDPGFQAYVRKIVALFAEAGSEIFLVDDDLRLSAFGSEIGCFCPNHIARFNALSGTDYSREEICGRIRNAEIGDPFLTAYNDMRVDSMVEFASMIRETIDCYNPEIRCGMCTPGSEFLSVAKVAKALAGKTVPFVRLPNACYLESSAKGYPYFMYNTVEKKSCCKEIPEIIDESDTWPQNRFSESATSMNAHITGSIINGLNGGKLWITNLAFPDSVDSAAYEQILRDNMKLYSALEKLVHGICWQGPFSVIRNLQRFWNPLTGGSANPWHDFVTEWANIYGIPAHFGVPSDKGIHLIAGHQVDHYSDEELRAALCGPVLLDGDAAMLVSERGLSELLGVVPEIKEFRFSHEYEFKTGLRHPLNNDFTCKYLNVKDQSVEILSEFRYLPFFRSPDYKSVAPGTTFYRNSLGGRVAVTAWSLTMARYNFLRPHRGKQFLAILEKLKGTPFEITADESQDLYFMHGKLSSGGDLLFFMNMNFDPMKTIHLCCQEKPERFERLMGDGTWKELVFTRNGCNVVLEQCLSIFDPVVIRASFRK